jgi:hypothetical protein
MEELRLTLTSVLLMLLAACGCSRNHYTACDPEGLGPRVFHVDHRDERHIFHSSRAQELRIRNLTKIPAVGITLTLNSRWSAGLCYLRVATNGWDTVVGQDTIPAGGEVRVNLSTDVPNYTLFRDSQGKTMPQDTELQTIRIDSDKAAEVFLVHHLTKPIKG